MRKKLLSCIVLNLVLHGVVLALEGINGENMHCSVRVLIADDNEVNRDVVTGMLEILQCETAIARDGYEAIECCSQDAFDLVFMDCQMPGLDGYSATRAIRELESKRGGRVPIVALTANVMYEAEEKCIEAGMDDYLSKPFFLNSLKEKVVKWTRVEKSSSGADESGASALKKFGQAAAEIHGRKTPDDNQGAGALDQNVLVGLKALQVQGSSDMFTRVIKLYLDSTRELVEALQAACCAGEHEKIGQYAHALKSSSVNVGAIRLSGYLAELEIKAREEMLEGVEDRSANIVREYGLVVSALRNEVSR